MLMKRCNSDVVRAFATAAALLALPCAASAQDKAVSPRQGVPGLIDQVGDWFGRQAESVQSVFQGAGHEVRNFGREAGVMAERTAGSAKDAADNVATIPNMSILVRMPESQPCVSTVPTRFMRTTLLQVWWRNRAWNHIIDCTISNREPG